MTDATQAATVAICTRDRPDELTALLASIGRSRSPGDRPCIEIVVVENGPNRAGLDADRLAELAGWPVRVVHEPRPGVAFARNTAIRSRGPAPLLIMVDDDQTVARGWLEAHLRGACNQVQADVITGPVLTIIPPDAPEWARLMWRNVPRHRTGSVQRSFLGGNVCFRAAIFDEVDEWFDEARPLATADDAWFGRRLTELGYRIEWNDLAIAWEHVHPARLTHRWFIERYLSFGGFEAEYAVRHRGRRVAVREGIGDAVRGLGRGLVAAVRMRHPEHHAAAVAHTFQALGWFGGIAGRRVSDYRRVTSR